MRQVYNSCERCLVWLGEFAEDVSIGVEVISKIEDLRHATEETCDTVEDLRESAVRRQGIDLGSAGAFEAATMGIL